MSSKEKSVSQQKFDVIIVGGGLAGLTSAIHLSRNNLSVLVIEKNKYPNHKVCGEYVSNEVLPYLHSLEIDPFFYGAKVIEKFEVSASNSRLANASLPLGGFGISRYTFDQILAVKAKEKGAEIRRDTVDNIFFENDEFSVKTKSYSQFKSKIVLGAYGKRSSLDAKLKRDHISKRSPFLAVKIHAIGEHPANLVSLHNFKGGYCGVSKIENDHLNLCYITSFKSFKKYKDIQAFQEQVVFKNKHLKTVFQSATPVFDAPISISQISFANKAPVHKHVLMCGDTAGLIHPLCGNGMSMAIRSAKMISELVVKYLNGEVSSRLQLEDEYTKSWNKEFRLRLKVGRIIAAIFENDRLTKVAITLLIFFPGILPVIIRLTHGKPMTVK